MHFMTRTQKDSLIDEIETKFGHGFTKIAEYPIPEKAVQEIIDCKSSGKGIRFVLNEDDGSFMVCANFYPTKDLNGFDVEMIGTTNYGVEFVLPSVTAEGMETVFNAYAFGRTEGLRALYWEKYMEHAAVRLKEDPYMDVDNLTLELCKVGQAEKKMYKRIGVYSELKPYVGNILENLPILRGIAIDALRRRNSSSRG